MSKDSVLDEVIRWSAPLPIQPDEFTVDDYVARLERHGESLSRGAARGRLERLVEGGKLAKRRMVHNGTQCNVYRILEGSESTPDPPPRDLT